MTRLLQSGLAALGLVGAVAVAGPAHAQAAFEGAWSVLIVTEAGTCDRAYRYAININKGIVRYAGEASIDLSGRVNPNGAVTVTVSRGQQNATGKGRMTKTAGAGTWTGRSGNQQCSGRWEAERRS
jgi:hypothetical protein